MLDHRFSEGMAGWLKSAPIQRADHSSEAPYYDLLYADHTVDYEYWDTFAEPRGVLVELGAGTGRLTTRFAGAGWFVRAVEPCEPLLNRLNANVAGLDNVQTFSGSACDIPVADGSADAVVAPSSVFSFLLSPQEQLKAVTEAYRVLKPGGSFHASVNYYPHGNIHSSGRLFQHWFEHLPDGAGGQIYFGGEARLNADWNICEYLQTIDAVHSDGRFERHLVRLDSHLYTPFELFWLFMAAGLEQVAVYGDYECGPVTATSDVLIASGVRAGN